MQPPVRYQSTNNVCACMSKVTEGSNVVPSSSISYIEVPYRSLKQRSISKARAPKCYQTLGLKALSESDDGNMDSCSFKYPIISEA